ncbi:Fic/DOC family N-terminal domain-containing protein [Lachnotalea sp. AF33-28]|uniref:Fic/DOC family N-terminal domain-containing protein n=1 Tax=Lachnotalea sp. AF33-28 TaxID=2292046 RepID=UPI0013141E19
MTGWICRKDFPLAGDTARTSRLPTAHPTILESIASRIPSVSLFVSVYVRKEALLSSQIEGTYSGPRL